jgi:hypothetical protein
MNEPVSLVEIDREVCSLTFGVAPCPATGTPCYNTWRTCAATTAYAPTTQTLRFVKPRADLPMSWDAVPSLVSTSASPTELNVGDVDASSGPLGKRAQANITLQDHPTSDIQLDPYVSTRGGNPFARGTFWTRLKARWPYYKGRKIRILDGYIGQALSAMQRREFLIDAIDGPDSRGRVTIKAVDPLRILDDKTSQAPKQSQGELSAAITAVQTTLTVTGALLADYPVSGTLRIGSELMTYTGRTLSGGILTFTGITRGTDGSVAATHEIESRVQTCLRYTDVNAWEVAKGLIQAYAPSAYAFIDTAQWQAEADQWLDGFIVSGVVSEATGLNQLLAELCRDAQFFIWWDERQQKILLRALRPPEGVPAAWNDDANIIAGSQSLQYRPDERISQIWYYYQPRDLSKKLDDEANYRKVRIRIDAESESDREYDEVAVTKIFSRWVRTDAIVTAITTRLLNRYRDTPFYLTVSVDAKDNGVWTADIVDVTTRLITNADGLPLSQRYTIISAQETSPGSVVKYVLQSYSSGGGGGTGGGRYGYYMITSAPIFSAATDEQKLSGGWWAQSDGLMPDGTPGYEYQ